VAIMGVIMVDTVESTIITQSFEVKGGSEETGTEFHGLHLMWIS
jgi:hypothetical protein